jgi:G:T-mismatch repair DNA endonuclease (very short patch repair protein)
VGVFVIERACPVCEKIYEADPKRVKFGRQTTCSRECSYLFRATKITKSETLVCAYCGAQFERPPSQRRAKHGSEFCSRQCHYEGRSRGLSKRVVEKPYSISEAARDAWREGAKKTRATRLKKGNYAHTDETKRLMSERTSRAIAEGKIRRVSKLEDRVAVYLEHKEVAFQRQYGIRDPISGRYLASLDFFVNEGVAVEVNGTFWHSDPRFYDQEKLAPSQLRSLERWNTKLGILSHLGIPLIVVWEHDLKEDFEGTLDALVESLKA